jgi:hypothetical protein
VKLSLTLDASCLFALSRLWILLNPLSPFLAQLSTPKMAIFYLVGLKIRHIAQKRILRPEKA